MAKDTVLWKAKAFRYNLCIVTNSKCSGDLMKFDL